MPGQILNATDIERIAVAMADRDDEQWAEMLDASKVNWRHKAQLLMMRLHDDGWRSPEEIEQARIEERNDIFRKLVKHLKEKYGEVGRNSSRQAAYRVAKDIALAMDLDLAGLAPFLREIDPEVERRKRHTNATKREIG